jgi:hypothetical protein
MTKEEFRTTKFYYDMKVMLPSGKPGYFKGVDFVDGELMVTFSQLSLRAYHYHYSDIGLIKSPLEEKQS